MTCTHAPNYQHGCIPCETRYVKMLRPDRKRQDAFLARLATGHAEIVLAALKAEAA